MKKISLILALIAAISLTVPTTVLAANTKAVEGFDFNYTSETHSGFNLVQVFDDGDMTYFQFSDHTNFPSVDIVHDNGRREAVALEAKTPYLIVRGVANRFALSKDKKTIFVRYNGRRILQTPVQEVKPVAIPDNKPQVIAIGTKQSTPVSVSGQGANSAESASASGENKSGTQSKKNGDLTTAIKINVPFYGESVTVSKKSREDIEEKIRQLRFTHRAVIHARPSTENDMQIARTRAFALSSILRGVGMSEDDIERAPQQEVVKGKNPGFFISEIILIEGRKVPDEKEVSNAPPPKPKFIVKAGESVSDRLSDWAKKYGYTLVWEAADYRSGTDITIDKDFDQTLQAVVAAMKINGVHLEPTIFENQVVRIVENK